jgi:hypothetical protein
LGIEKCKLREM